MTHTNINLKDTQYHLLMTGIHTDTIKNIRLVIKAGLFKKESPESHKRNLINLLKNELCKVYNLQPIEIVFDKNFLGSGCYIAEPLPVIVINKPSLVTFLHEFWHYNADKNGLTNDEETPRAFSHSAFYQATPKLFKNAVEKGLLIHQKVILENKNNVSY